MKIHFCWINRKHFWVIEKWIISPVMFFSFHCHPRFHVWSSVLENRYFVLICKCWSYFFLSFSLNHRNLQGLEFYDFFEDSICLMLQEISSGNLFKLFWKDFTFDEISSWHELHVVVSICISWTKSIEKNLIKIWKWLHAVFKNHPHELCQLAETKRSQQYDNYSISNAIIASNTDRAACVKWCTVHVWRRITQKNVHWKIPAQKQRRS